jgi:hypothetical protein
MNGTYADLNLAHGNPTITRKLRISFDYKVDSTATATLISQAGTGGIAIKHTTSGFVFYAYGTSITLASSAGGVGSTHHVTMTLPGAAAGVAVCNVNGRAANLTIGSTAQTTALRLGGLSGGGEPVIGVIENLLIEEDLGSGFVNRSLFKIRNGRSADDRLIDKYNSGVLTTYTLGSGAWGSCQTIFTSATASKTVDTRTELPEGGYLYRASTAYLPNPTNPSSLTLYPINAARFTADGLLLEPVLTNQYGISATTDIRSGQGGWVKTNAHTETTGFADPLGGTAAVRHQMIDAGAIYDPVTVTNAHMLAFTVWGRSTGTTPAGAVDAAMTINGGTSWVSAVDQRSVAGSPWANVAPDAWRPFIATGTASGTSTIISPVTTFDPSASTVRGDQFVWGAQLEKGFATTLHPAHVRSGEQLTLGGGAFIDPGSLASGCIYIQMKFYRNSTDFRTGTDPLIHGGEYDLDGKSNMRRMLIHSAGGWITSTGVTTGTHYFGAYNIAKGQDVCAALAWSGTNLCLYVNGTRLTDFNSFLGWPNFAELCSGAYDGGLASSHAANGALKGIVQYTSRPSDFQLEKLTRSKFFA